MKRKSMLTIGIAAAAVLTVFGARAISAQNNNDKNDKYSVKVPGGLAFADFRGYENWQLVSISQNGKLMAAILGNSTIIDAFRAGVPGNGKPFPDGSRMAKIHWVPKLNENAPGPPTVPGTQHDVDFMV
ncbi:MAG TPA: cytochrome P460 family protein, partial [Polyangia bacterium]